MRIALCALSNCARVRDRGVIGRLERSGAGGSSDEQHAGHGGAAGGPVAALRLVFRAEPRWSTGAPASSGCAPPLQAEPAGAVDAGAAGRPGAAAHERRAGRARRPLPADGGRGGLARAAISSRVRRMLADLPEALRAGAPPRMPPPPRPRRPPPACPTTTPRTSTSRPAAISRRTRRGSTTCRSRRCSWAPPGRCGARRCGRSPSSCAGRDQRHVTLLDVACGTGRFLRQVRLAYPGHDGSRVSICRAPIWTRRAASSTACAAPS